MESPKIQGPLADKLHAAGVNRHRSRWVAANMAASRATIGYGLTDQQLKELVPLIVLRVLDAVCDQTVR